MMSNTSSVLSTHVGPTPQGEGVIITVNNISINYLQVSFPNPYTGVRVYSESGEKIRISRTILCYEESDPEVILAPGTTSAAQITLQAFWFDLEGRFRVECDLKVTREGGVVENCVSSGSVDLAIPPLSLDQLRRRPKPRLDPRNTEAKLLNVSMFTKIIREY